MKASAADNHYDAIVVGAGHNGLTAAATLAKRGKRVLVLERSHSVGGMAKTCEIAPGIRGPRMAHLLYNLNPLVSSELDLEAHGLRIAAKDLPTVSLSPDGNHVVISGSESIYCDGGAHPDAEAFSSLWKRMLRYSALVGPLFDKTPPRLAGGGMSMGNLFQGAQLAKLGIDLRRMGKSEMREFLRVVLSNVSDLILDEIPDGPLAGAMAADAVLGAWAGPRSPGTVLMLMYRMARGGAKMIPVGGIGAVTEALAEAARAHGAEIRTGVGVESVLIHGDRVHGVAISGNGSATASQVFSSLDALSTLELVGAEHFDIEACRRVQNIRAKGTAAKINLALSAAPKFKALDDSLERARLLISPSVNYIERAFNPAKYGELPPEPMIEVVIPSLSDPSLCDGGGHVLSAIVQFVPYALKGGWSSAAREQLAKTSLAQLEAYAPGIGNLVIGSEVLSPADIEGETGARGGHWHHGEMAVDQMMMLRPTNGMARYASGVPGLYFCGASAHPGGDVTGTAGRNAALQSIRDGASR
jgi:phytoene dehydrogenase-like protein